jgi:ABC-type nitrate/sulfonate/bicarbonate transport system substrate-binding protein
MLATRVSEPTPAPATAQTVKKTGNFRINNPTSPSLLDMPYLMALESLREQGYTFEPKQYARFDLVAPALAKGELDIASSSVPTVWAAISKGAAVHTIASRFRNPYRMMVSNSIKTCADLHGKNLGVSATSGATFTMVQQNFERNCPGTVPNYILTPATANRIPALVGGQLDAAFLEVEDTLEVERRAPGKFSILIDFAAEQPDLVLTGVFVRDEFAEQNPELVKDFLRALIEASRAVQDEPALEQAMIDHLGMEGQPAHTAAEAYLKLGLWDVNGGITEERARATFKFMQEAQALPADADPDDYVDLSFLNSVLGIVGKR